jgi:hypothetical protein
MGGEEGLNPMTVITNNPLAVPGSNSGRSIDNSTDVARKIPPTAIAPLSEDEELPGTIALADIPVFPASVDGRAKLADGFFTEAAATAKFAALAITTGLLKTGILAASVAGRALMATGYFTEAKATDAFAAGSIVGTLLKDLGVTTGKFAPSAVTGAKIATTAIKLLSFTGRNGAGAITLTGAAVGDRVVAVIETTATDTAAAAKFENPITTLNQIQQSDATDLSSKRYIALLLIASA